MRSKHNLAPDAEVKRLLRRNRFLLAIIALEAIALLGLTMAETLAR
jgi:hypothetical protein